MRPSVYCLALCWSLACGCSRTHVGVGSPPASEEPEVAGREARDAPVDADSVASTLSLEDVHFVVSTMRPGTRLAEAGVVSRDAPEELIVGFPRNGANWYSVTLVPPDGRVFYNQSSATGTADGAWFEWRADARWSRKSKYPKQPEQNDPSVATPKCENTRFSTILPRPEGGYLYACANGLFDSDGEMIADADFASGLGPYALTYGNILLGRPPFTQLLCDLDTLTTREIRGFPDSQWTITAARAVKDGFIVAVVPGPGRGDGDEAWHIGLDGSATRMGAYPELDDPSAVTGDFVLDARGALYSKTDREVTRRTIDGVNNVVYSIEDTPLVADAEGYIADVFSGP